MHVCSILEAILQLVLPVQVLSQKGAVFAPVVTGRTRVPSSLALYFLSLCSQGNTSMCLELICFVFFFQPCYETVKIWLQENLLAVGIFGLCTALVQVNFNTYFQILSNHN